jgi:drug/metabolite transporter (DMT)-like permease
MRFRLDYIYIIATVAFTAYGQIILKWRIAKFGAMPAEAAAKLRFLLAMFLDPIILSGFVAAFLAALAWMAAMTKFDLSEAYPFTSLNFVIVLLLSAWLLSEPLSANKIWGVLFIIVGTFLATRS